MTVAGCEGGPLPLRPPLAALAVLATCLAAVAVALAHAPPALRYVTSRPAPAQTVPAALLRGPRAAETPRPAPLGLRHSSVVSRAAAPTPALRDDGSRSGNHGSGAAPSLGLAALLAGVALVWRAWAAPAAARRRRGPAAALAAVCCAADGPAAPALAAAPARPSPGAAPLPSAGLHPYSARVRLGSLGWAARADAVGYCRVTTARAAVTNLKIFSPEKFTGPAKGAVRRAQGEAKRLGLEKVGTDMLLLGLVAEKNGLASKVLLEKVAPYDVLRTRVEHVVGNRGGGLLSVFQGNKPFDEDLKNVLELADGEAFRTKCDSVGTEHLLLALLKESNCRAMLLLRQMGIDVKNLERAMLVRIQLEKAEALEEARRAEEAKRPKQRKSKKLSSDGGTGDDQSHLSLKDFSTNVTDLAKAGQLDPLIGRNKEVERVTQILGRRRKNNAVLVGEPGVGKTAIAEGIALRIVNGQVPPTLKRKQIIELDMGMLVAGTKYRGEFEERLGNILREVEENEDIVLVIDEIHTLVGAGGSEGGSDAANLLKPAMARGALQLIGATTLEEYRKYIEKDAALERRFQPVDVPEPTEAECVEILTGLKERYENHHGCEYTPKAIEAAVHMSKRYIADRFLPDKAIDVIDEAGARMRLRHDTPELSEAGLKLVQELKEVTKQKESATKAQDYMKALGLFEREAELTALIEQEKKRNKELSEAAQWAGLVSAIPIVTESDIAQVIAAISGVPVDKVSATESSSLMNLEHEMREMMVGQVDAVQAISQAIRRARTGMRDPSRPIGSFIFAGPTGVGKSQLAKALCTSYFGSEENMVRLDMSEYMEKHTVSKLIGSPPGYVGYDEGGGLTEKVRRSPYTLVLFDEVEKAHKDVFNLMLQILDDGRLTDAKGRTVDFKNTMVIMTTNIGSDVIMKQSKKAQEANPNAYLEDNEVLDEAQYQVMKKDVDNELKKFFRPEFLNRLDGIIVFHKLTKKDVREIAEIFLKKTFKRMQEKKVTLEITPEFKERLVEMGYNPTYGARPLRRAMSTMIEDQLAEVVLRGRLKENDTVTMDLDGHDTLIVYNQDGDLLYRKDISGGNFGIT